MVLTCYSQQFDVRGKIIHAASARGGGRRGGGGGGGRGGGGGGGGGGGDNGAGVMDTLAHIPLKAASDRR